MISANAPEHRCAASFAGPFANWSITVRWRTRCHSATSIRTGFAVLFSMAQGLPRLAARFYAALPWRSRRSPLLM